MANLSARLCGVAHRLEQAELFFPAANPTLRNPDFATATARVLIVRLSPWHDVARSTPHLVLAAAARQALPGVYLDFAFFPPARDRQWLTEHDLPWLFGIASAHTADDFQAVLISNSHLLELLNLPPLLSHSGVPLLASARHEPWPPLVLGGSNAAACQALVSETGDSLVDAIFFGEGEEALPPLIRALVGPGDKPSRLRAAASLTPALWRTGQWPQTPLVPAVVRHLDAAPAPVPAPVLNGPEAGTARLQVSAGCPAGCAFCFESFDRRPYRELGLDELLRRARALKQQGAEELELYSFNFNTHREIIPLLLELNRLFERVTAKSQRVDLLYGNPHLLAAETLIAKTSFSLGLEGVSQRLRDFLHKSLPAATITAVLHELLALPIRELKLFYLMTGYETAADVQEFRAAVRELKAARQQRHSAVRVIFSFGYLVRMPGTPLRHDRLFLDPAEFTQVGPLKSACETNGFEFRLASSWDEYALSQVLAAGGYWLHRPLLEFAAAGDCYDQRLPAGCWERWQQWLRGAGYWHDRFLGAKPADYPFPFAFVRRPVSPEFLYRQYQAALAGDDDGYCLGNARADGRCRACGACPDATHRTWLTTHRPVLPSTPQWRQHAAELATAKRRLKPIHAILRLSPALAGATPEWLNAQVFRALLVTAPALLEPLLAVREQLFTLKELRRAWPTFAGETVFALKTWDAPALVAALPALIAEQSPDVQFVALLRAYTPGVFQRARLTLDLPAAWFPDAARHFAEFLRAAHVPVTMRRVGEATELAIPAAAHKRHVIFGGTCRETTNGFSAELEIGPKFDLGAFLAAWPEPGLHRRATSVLSELRC